MLVKRLLVTIVLLPLGILAIAWGGWLYWLIVTALVGLAAWEYVQLTRLSGFQPAAVLVVAGTLALLAGRAWNGFESAPPLLGFLVLVSMAYHLIDYERGRDQAPIDFGVTLGGIFYLGWIGAYFISLRDLPEGKWWTLVVLESVWLADSGAFFIGRRFGRHKLSPRLSPKKSWEGYIAGLFTGTLLGALFAALWQWAAGPGTAITPLRGMLVGLVMSIFPTLGDLGESMFKRQAGVKDSGSILPGHGGTFDRIDSWLWAAMLGYYMITWLWLGGN